MSTEPPGSSSQEDAKKDTEPHSSGPKDSEGEIWLWNSSAYTYTGSSEKKEVEAAVVECWTWGLEGKNRPIPPFTRYDIKTFDIASTESWLQEDLPLRDGQRPSSGFQLAMIPCGETSLSPELTQEEENRLHAAAGIPSLLNHHGSLGNGGCGMFSQTDDSYVFLIRRNVDRSSISTVMRYDPQTNVTRGVFHMSTGTPGFNVGDFRKLPAQFVKCSHPLLLPLLAIEMTFDQVAFRLRNYQEDLKVIEGKTGYGISRKLETTSDYRELIQELGGHQAQSHVAFGAIQLSKLAAQFLRQKLDHLNKMPQEDYQKQLDPFYEMLTDRMDFLLSTMEHAYEYNGMRERMELQKTVLFNLIAQSDSLVNISLAKDSRETAVASKQDSSAMKIIALLTTFFLPGTFVATFFAMPFFDWSKPSISRVAGDHFWVYWAVTIPLTLTTMAGVIAWALWHNRRVELLQSQARDSVGAGPAGDGAQGNGKEDHPGAVEEEKKEEA